GQRLAGADPVARPRGMARRRLSGRSRPRPLPALCAAHAGTPQDARDAALSRSLGPRAAELAERLIDAWRSRRPLSALDATRLAPQDDDTACAVQEAVGAALEWFPAGRPHAWKIASVPPTAAAVPDAFILRGPQRLRRTDFHTL